MKCVAGYKPKAKGEFSCLYGTYSGFDSEPDGTPDPTHLLPVCVKQSCGAKPTVASATVSDCTQGDDTLEDTCKVYCNPGYKRSGAATVSCTVETTGPEDKPKWSTPGTCAKQSCGSLTLSDAQGVVGTLSGDKTGDTVSVSCKTGYMPSATSDKTFSCAPTSTASESPSQWTGSLTCTPVVCPKPANPSSGTYNCGGTTFKSTCALECPAGTALQGNGILECDATGKFSGASGSCAAGQCKPPAKTANMASTGAPGNVVDSGASFKPSCADGYEPTGTFKCTNGVYTETAICRREGAPAAEKVYYVEGKLQVSIKLPAGKTLAQMKEDTAFMNALKKSVADALDGVNPADVEIIIDDRRRLLEADERQLQEEATLNVRYKIKTANKAAATALSNQIANNKAAFEESFKKTMKDEANIEVTGMVTEAPAVSESYQEPGAGTGGTGTGDDDGGSNTGAIVGGIVGGLVGLALLGGAFFYFSKKTSSQE